jgi:polysaccharide biosynthesis protein PelA
VNSDTKDRYPAHALLRRIARITRLVLVGVLSSVAHAQWAWSAGLGPSIALFYGTQPPVAQLSRFDVVVLEPDSGFEPRAHRHTRTVWFAYVSVGEMTPQRPYYAGLPKEWLLGSNAVWGSQVIDQAAAGWPAYYVEHVIDPLWRKGYRGFFLDTLDSYQRIARTDVDPVRQEAGLVAVIRAIKQRYPRAKLIFNRGFEILPQVHSLAYAVAFESLFRGWDQAQHSYTEVPQADRDWLLAQAKKIRQLYRLPVLSIDYCPPDDHECARDTAAKISDAGLIPYVTDGGLATVGVGPAPGNSYRGRPQAGLKQNDANSARTRYVE